MRKVYGILAAAVTATAIPVMASAATVTYTFDSADLEVSTDGGNSFNPVQYTGTLTNPVVTVPVGSIFELGVDADVTNNVNAGKGVGYDSVKHNQPTNLGLLQYQVGLTASAPTIAALADNGAGQTTANINANFTSNQAAGVLDGMGGTSATLGVSGTNIVTGTLVTSTVNIAKVGYAGGVAAEIFNSLEINAVTAGTATFQLTDLDGGLQYATNTTPGTATPLVGPTYTNTTFNPATDTLGTLPKITLIVGSGTTSPTATPIISLTAGTTAPTGFGTQLTTANATFSPATPVANSINVAGANGSYTPGFASVNASGGATSGYVQISGFNPAADKEVYALKLDIGGATVAQTDSRLSTIVTDINASLATDGVTASLLTGTTLGSALPTYDIELTSTGTGAAQDILGFNFVGETNIAGVTVTAVAAIPEPASMGLLALGATGLLAGRRRRGQRTR